MRTVIQRLTRNMVHSTKNTDTKRYFLYFYCIFYLIPANNCLQKGGHKKHGHKKSGHHEDKYGKKKHYKKGHHEKDNKGE